jgi:DNA-binding beta-propeller fold protein YncE
LLVTCRIGFFDDLKDKQARDDYPTIVFYGTNGVLHRMDPDGSNRKILISSLGHPPVGLAINRKTGTLYWSDQITAKVYQASTSGTNLTEVLNQDVGQVTGIDVDESTGYIYMADFSGNRILKVPAGTMNGDADIFPLTIIGGVSAPWDVAVDNTGGYLYFIEGGATDRLSRVSLSGGAKSVLVDTDTIEPYSIEIDVTSNNLYWSDIGSGDGINGDDLFRTSLTSADPVASNSSLSIVDVEDPRSLALYPDAGYLYWISGDFFAGGTLCRGSTDELSGDVSGFEFSTIIGVTSVVVDYWTGN